MGCRVGCWCTVAVLPLRTLPLPTGLALQSAQNQLPGLQEPVGVMDVSRSVCTQMLRSSMEVEGSIVVGVRVLLLTWMGRRLASVCVGGIGAGREGGAWHGLGAGKVQGVARRKAGGGSAQLWKASMPG